VGREDRRGRQVGAFLDAPAARSREENQQEDPSEHAHLRASRMPRERKRIPANTHANGANVVDERQRRWRPAYCRTAVGRMAARRFLVVGAVGINKQWRCAHQLREEGLERRPDDE
jgi:hypothetical protein